MDYLLILKYGVFFCNSYHATHNIFNVLHLWFNFFARNLNFNCILKKFLSLICSEKNFWPIERMKINSDVSGKGWLILSARGFLAHHVKWLTCSYFPLNVLICPNLLTWFSKDGYWCVWGSLARTTVSEQGHKCNTSISFDCTHNMFVVS